MTLNDVSQDDLLTVNPERARFTHEDIQKQYDDDAEGYRRWGGVADWFFGVTALRRRLFTGATGSVLDVACGTGENFAFLRHVDSIIAGDLSSGMLAQAEDRIRQLRLSHITLRQLDAQSLDFPDDTFDTVTTALSTCTFPDPLAALREMSRVCKPGGKILLVEHGRSSAGWVGRWQDKRAHKHYEAHGCRWTQEPHELVAAAGLTVSAHQRVSFGIFHAIEARPTA